MLEPQAVLDALREPTLVVGSHCEVISANRAAKNLLGAVVPDRPLTDFVADDRDAFELYLQRCFGSGQPLIGTLMLQTQGETKKFSCRGNAFPADGDRFVLLRLSENPSEQSFAALTRTIASLTDELKKRQRSEAILAETVRERELLLRELEHRVKNNMQMLAAMLSGAEREATLVEAKIALREASMRFSAVSAVQQLLYRSDTLTTISAEKLVATLIRGAQNAAPSTFETELAIEPIQLPMESAVPIGLMINELLTNAVKYGRPDEGIQKLRVEFARNGKQIDFIVTDNGPGFDLSETGKRASGIGLVRGLLRQLGGSIRVERDGGARCVVSFPNPGRTSKGSLG